ncbi:MAG: hypothetical protein GXP37_12095 [Chloroflexi bacterium]|nr:hypothetical protein [Chloroflexota bacterium]
MNASDPRLNPVTELSSDTLLDANTEEPVVEIERGLGFTDGFQFGCGFWVAAVVTGIVVGLLGTVILFVLSSVGIQLLG